MKAFKIQTPLNYSIAVQEYPSKKPSQKFVIIASATGVKQKYYSNFSEFLTENGFTVFTFDYGGIGDSLPTSLKKFNTTASNWAKNDFESVIQHVHSTNPNCELFLITHSIGGQLLGIVPSNHLFKGIITVASQSGSYNHWKGIDKLMMLTFWHLYIPISLKVFNYLSIKKLIDMENLPKGVAKEWASWCKNKNYHFDFIENCQENYNQITCDLISYSSEKVFFAPTKAVDWLSEKFNNASVTRNHLLDKDFDNLPIRHFGFFKKKFKNSIWKLFLNDLTNFK